MGCVVNATPRSLYPRDRPGTHCIGEWVGSRAGLDGCAKSRFHRDSIPGPSVQQRVTVPTELSWPSCYIMHMLNCYFLFYLHRTCLVFDSFSVHMLSLPSSRATSSFVCPRNYPQCLNTSRLSTNI